MSRSTFKSPIWLYYDVKNEVKSTSVCKVCKSPISRGTGNDASKWGNGTMLRHLKSQHPDLYQVCTLETALFTFINHTCLFQEYENQMGNKSQKMDENEKCLILSKDENNDVPSSSKQLKIKDSFLAQKPYDSKSTEQQKLNHKIFEWIVDNAIPYTVVSSSTYLAMMRQANIKCSIPSEKYFRTVMMPDTYLKVKARIRSIIDEVDVVSLTTDMWTSQAKHTYASLTTHFIDKNWRRKTVILGISVSLDIMIKI